MSLNDEVRLDVLFRELTRVREKALKTDEWFFALVSVAMVPFLVLIGYCVINTSYRILITSILPISMFCFLAIANLLNHYLYVRHYASYLEDKVNKVLGTHEIRHVQFSQVFYSSPCSIVKVSFGSAFLGIALSNVLLVPLINHVLTAFLLTHPNLPTSYKWLLQNYWTLIIISWCLVLVATALSFWSELYQAKRLVREVRREDPAGSETNKQEKQTGVRP